jgi:ribosomal protein L32
MTIEGHIENLKAIASDMPSDKCADWIESLMAGVKALEREPCGDAISRQAVLDLPRIKTHNVWGNVIYESVDVENVRQLPPVTPQPKMGKWRRINKEKYVQHAMSYYRCSECGEEIIGKHNYCPNCGAKMQEVEE